MKTTTKTIALSVLLLFSSLAWAVNWVKVDSSVDGERTFYVDSDSIRKDGNLRKAWEIQDLKKRNKDGEMSRRMRVEYDCKNERSRILAFSTHSEGMARGEILFSASQVGSWREIPPGTIGELYLKFVCSR